LFFNLDTQQGEPFQLNLMIPNDQISFLLLGAVLPCPSFHATQLFLSASQTGNFAPPPKKRKKVETPKKN